MGLESGPAHSGDLAELRNPGATGIEKAVLDIANDGEVLIHKRLTG